MELVESNSRAVNLFDSCGFILMVFLEAGGFQPGLGYTERCS